uniref:Phosphofurin acidic cluster sorting protein 1-like n=1 Tax=Saccoglossus kowalevskii TaxID=10224 RepID=A0ABM0M413_SACKO|nr:PREDICTED: phosphofurin acidic cluster sorting protein 1-like [Saccoglossus kowalevskii]
MATAGTKPVPMKLFASWEVDRTSHNCIPRLCSLRLTRLMVLRALESDLNSVVIAVKMQSMKRTLRSNEIFIPQSGLLDTELDLAFSLQYPHFLKREGNKLQIMLQRRKKYKNRTILGFKTLASGLVSMSQVLQKSVDNELNLYSNSKDGRVHVAQVVVWGLTSQPVDQDDQIRRKRRGHDRSPDVYNYSDDDDESFSSDQEGSDSGDLIADKGAVSAYLAGLTEDDPYIIKDLLGEEEQERTGKPTRGKLRASSRQRNFKQKFIALLKKFKVAEEVEVEPDLYVDQDQPVVDDDFDDDIDDLNVSDSGPDMDDNLSIESTPKPVLRPFFGSTHGISTSNLQLEERELSNSNSIISDENDDFAHQREECLEDEISIASLVNSPSKDNTNTRPATPPSRTNFIRDRSISLREKSTISKDIRALQRRNSAGHADNKQPRRSLPDQLSNVWSLEDQIPDNIILMNTAEWQGQLLSQALEEDQHRVVCTCCSADVQATFAFIVNRIQKLNNGPKTKRITSCNSNSANPPPLKLAVAGNDAYVNNVLRPYVEQFSAKSPDWQNYIRFLIIPLGANSLAKYLASIDPKYNALFMDSVWRDSFEKTDKENTDYNELVLRVDTYLNNASNVFSLPIAEAMVNYRSNSEEDSVQKFVPFINDVRAGSLETHSLSGDWEEAGIQISNALSSSPPNAAAISAVGVAGSSVGTAVKESNTPPPSPAINIVSPQQSSPASSPSTGHILGELMDLQVEYWTSTIPSSSSGIAGGSGGSGGGKFKDSAMKSSLKTAFRSLSVCRLPSAGDSTLTSTLSMGIVIKEKNKKIMRIGKKQKEAEPKSQIVEGINRLICMCKNHTNPLTVSIDGVDWPSVKFFQISAQWSTHMRHFPVLMFAYSEAPH